MTLLLCIKLRIQPLSFECRMSVPEEVTRITDTSSEKKGRFKVKNVRFRLVIHHFLPHFPSPYLLNFSSR